MYQQTNPIPFVMDRLYQLEQRVFQLEQLNRANQTYSQGVQGYQAFQENQGNLNVQESNVTFAAGQQEQIVAVQKNENGNITAVQTESGRVLGYDQALAEAKAGRLAHVDVFHKYGREILRSEPDGIRENNLDRLPTF